MSTYGIQEPLLDLPPIRRRTKRRTFLLLSLAALSVVVILVGVLTNNKDDNNKNHINNLGTQSFSTTFDYGDLEDPVPRQERSYIVVLCKKGKSPFRLLHYLLEFSQVPGIAEPVTTQQVGRIDLSIFSPELLDSFA